MELSSGLSGWTFRVTKPLTSLKLGWRLAAEYWGQGLATEGAQAVVDYGFQTLGLKEIVAITVPANTRSRRVMERLGMTPEGHSLRRHVLHRLRRLDGRQPPGRKISMER
jgi:RimJ/RimL family protein N-acetyltransferase